MDVVGGRIDRIPVQNNGVVATLKDMPPFVTKSIKPIRKGRLEPTHPLHQIGLRRFHTQVVVIAHQDPRIQDPSLRLTSLPQTLYKTVPRSFAFEYPRTVIPSVDDVITRTAELHSDYSSHDRSPTIPALSD